MKKMLAIGLVLCIMISLALIPVSVHAVAKGDYYIIKGTATDVIVVDIVIIGPKGCEDIPLSVENGFYHTMATVAEDNTFEKDVYIPEEADAGGYTAAVLTAGGDGKYGTTAHGEGELIEALLEEHGIDEENFVGKSTGQLLVMIEEATVDKAGSDEMMTMSTFNVELPYIGFDNIEVVGDQLIVTGKTNRARGTSITISLTGPAELPSVTPEVEWPTPDYGVFEATFDITDAIAGAYTIKANDGEGNTAEATIEIGQLVPTSVPQGIIRGNVYDAEMGSPIEGATVECFEVITTPIYPPQPPVITKKDEVISDSSGYFEFKGLVVNQEGIVGGSTYSYNITVKHREYETKSKTAYLSDSEPQAYLKFELQPTIEPNFKVTNLIVSPSEVKVGDTVTIIADVKNVGDATGTYTLKISVNGAIIHTEEVALSPEETKSVKCYYTPQSEGSYEVKADGLRREFKAISLEITPTPTPTGEPELSISQTTLKEEPEVGEEVLITVAILNKGKATAKNIHLEEHIPSSIAVNYVEGANKAGGLVYWNGELEPGEAHSITHTLRILEEKSRTIPVTVTYEDASGNKKYKTTEIYLTAEIEKEVAPTPSPLSNIPWLYIIILVAVVLVGLAIIVAVRRGGEGGAEVTIEENK